MIFKILREYTNFPLLGGWKWRPLEKPLLSVHLYPSYTYQVTKLQTNVMIWILRENSGRHNSLILYRHLKDVTAYFNTDLFYSLLSRELFTSTHHYWTWLANLESHFTKNKELISEEDSSIANSYSHVLREALFFQKPYLYYYIITTCTNNTIIHNLNLKNRTSIYKNKIKGGTIMV